MFVMPRFAAILSPPAENPSARMALALALALASLFGACPPLHAASRQSMQASRTRLRSAPSRDIDRAAMIQAGTGDALGARIVAFARAHAGQQVGDGECTDLADAALQSAGARGAAAYATVTADSDYVWGHPVALRDARPGDILQFRDFNVTTTVTTNMAVGFGRTAQAQSWDQEQRPHHTAIVEQNLGGVLSVFEQNAPPDGRQVQINRVPITAMTVQGAAADGYGFATTEIQVDGEVQAYRPQPL